jgi:hypothetical protein
MLRLVSLLFGRKPSQGATSHTKTGCSPVDAVPAQAQAPVASPPVTPEDEASVARPACEHGHARQATPAKGPKCYNCGTRGHYAKDCPDREEVATDTRRETSHTDQPAEARAPRGGRGPARPQPRTEQRVIALSLRREGPTRNRAARPFQSCRPAHSVAPHRQPPPPFRGKCYNCGARGHIAASCHNHARERLHLRLEAHMERN